MYVVYTRISCYYRKQLARFEVGVVGVGDRKMEKKNELWMKILFWKIQGEVPYVSDTLILDPNIYVQHAPRLLAGIQSTVGNWQQNISVSWRWTDYHTDVLKSKCKWEIAKNISIRLLQPVSIWQRGTLKKFLFELSHRNGTNVLVNVIK